MAKGKETKKKPTKHMPLKDMPKEPMMTPEEIRKAMKNAKKK
jgi:hypothetical protein